MWYLQSLHVSSAPLSPFTNLPSYAIVIHDEIEHYPRDLVGYVAYNTTIHFSHYWASVMNVQFIDLQGKFIPYRLRPDIRVCMVAYKNTFD